MTPVDWILSNNTGTSSITIWSVMMDDVEKAPDRVDIPSDPSDFGRCHRLLQHFPEWRERLPEVAARYPKWGPMVEAWDELTTLFEEESPSGKAPKMYNRMLEIREDCMIADGWEKIGHGSWRKPAA